MNEHFEHHEREEGRGETERASLSEQARTKYPVWLVCLCIALLISTVYFAYFDRAKDPQDLNIVTQEKKEDRDLAYYEARYKKVDELREFVKKNFYKEVSDKDFDEWIIRGLFLALDDPYSSYFTPEEYQSFMELNEGSYGGLGISISPEKNGYITVISTFEDTPASRAGIRHNDKILKVDGVEYPAEKMDVAISKMKGEPGTMVSLTILRDNEEIELNLERAQIVIHSVSSEMLPGEDKIAYIRIRSFDQKVSQEFYEQFDRMEREGMRGFVLDLRGNPGGSLAECVDVADFLLGEQRIVSTENRSGDKYVFDSGAGRVDQPFVVLIDGGSASASEILAAAIQDGASAKLVGTRTFGKGVVQTVSPELSDGSGFKITTSEYFTPSGKSIHEKGVEPDVEVKLSNEFSILDKSSDNQLGKALELLKQELN